MLAVLRLGTSHWGHDRPRAGEPLLPYLLIDLLLQLVKFDQKVVLVSRLSDPPDRAIG